jgi:NhaP-type Na+/H+ or K+/H+ antiporter
MLQRSLIGWFGIRGIGSLYYLAYAQGSLGGRQIDTTLASLTLSVISLSILLHGSSATPLLALYRRRAAARVKNQPR